MGNKNLVESKRKRRLLLMLPLLVVPFLTMVFWALGGGGTVGAMQNKNESGLNLLLPDAQLKMEKDGDKISFYELADQDSIKQRKQVKSDPYSNLSFSIDTSRGMNDMYDPYLGQNAGSRDPAEEKVYKKLDELNQQLLHTTSGKHNGDHSSGTRFEQSSSSLNKEEIDRLEGLMNHKNAEKDIDPELSQLNGMMDKILDIQHPHRLKERMMRTGKNEDENVSAIIVQPTSASVSLLDTSKNSDEYGSGFYSMAGSEQVDRNNTIEAEVHQSQGLVNGAVIKLRLRTDIEVKGVHVPAGSFVFGIVTLNGERLEVAIHSIHYQGVLFPVRLSVYDRDGLKGIYIPGALSREVAKQAMEKAAQNVELSALDPSLKVQAAATGINAMKNLITKKAKQVKVFIKAGYQVLLQREGL